jgi:hypothetical protein
MLTLLDAQSLSRAPCKAHGEMGGGHDKREHGGMVQCFGPRAKPGAQGREDIHSSVATPFAVIPAGVGIHKHRRWEEGRDRLCFILRRQRLWIPGSAARPRDDTLPFRHVMAGLVPAIPMGKPPCHPDRDHRHKAGDDERVSFGRSPGPDRPERSGGSGRSPAGGNRWLGATPPFPSPLWGRPGWGCWRHTLRGYRSHPRLHPLPTSGRRAGCARG